MTTAPPSGHHPPPATPGRILTLSDGRRLGYAEYGDPGGRPVLYFHGWPGSRLEPRPVWAFASESGARIIAPDRPGMGLSDPKPGRRFLDWPADVAELADSLGLERFAVLGVSGGGPYAAACARKMPERLTAAALAAGMGPLDAPDATRGMFWPHRLLVLLAPRSSSLVRPLLHWFARRVRRRPQRMLSQMLAHMPAADRAALEAPEIREALMDSFREAFRQGVEGVAWDGLLYTRPWGFRPGEISLPVHLWHGEADVNVPAAIGRHLASTIPRCRARFLPEEGHFSLLAHHIGEILEVLTTADHGG